ncbi:ras guanine-nucleotide exchange protein-like protein [Bimuria novae-zelandiae CBS 107.79]|uniref:Ras guanine-nucleotide exchange protein-like protein n=1 Tax=Bimuria novae-zelandiae CBS 107.79 TaxID=1447943 RepID=A0A6A5VSA7_9PLEO|nr:ras guanine-nucleotide exchange protein-like protein [Bimuria novae-zelandiae CBS 107.79]
MADFILETEQTDKHASALVAPLNIQKSPKRSRSRGPGHSRQSSSRGSRGGQSATSQSHMSPPLTPRSSHDTLSDRPSQPVFHNYLRAFYHFHPSSTVSSSTDESSITVSINQGDVILVHSVHPNGWADGTLLASGARGWLPTNYCEPYDHPTIRTLLNALTNLWDLVRDGENGDLLVFTKQDYVRSLIAGVRFFLERTECLTRDSPLIVAHVGLRRMRKGLLGDLSSLVKTAKKLQEVLQANDSPAPVFGRLDELVLKAFKLVTRAVRFLDIWAQDAVSLSFDKGEGNNRPLTPPSDSADLAVQPPPTSNQDGVEGAQANEEPTNVPQASASVTRELLDHEATQTRNLSRLSVAFSIPSDSDTLQSPLFPPHPQAQPKRWSITHRLSYTGKSQGARKQNLASERLNTAHDSFLGFIGSFIGLHLQSRSSEELAVTTQESVIACRNLLAVVEEVWERDSRRSEQLEQAREIMYTKLTELVQATKDMFSSSEAGMGDEMIMPDQGKQLVDAATSCVRSAGDCVTKARLVIERIGDFEFENGGQDLSQAIFDQLNQNQPTQEKPQETPQPELPSQPERVVETEKPLPLPPTDERKLLPPLVISESKPLPDVPHSPSADVQNIGLRPTQNASADSPAAISVRSSMSSVPPPLTHHAVPHLPQLSPSDNSQSPASITQRFFGKSPKTDSINASVADTSSTYRNSMRGETASILSQTSTRATTPEQSPAKQNSAQTPVSSLSSSSELRSVASEDVVAAEEHLLETTYAHELIYNKDGQISGGSLPALVEQLTLHDSTPDTSFVTTFYLTFRLFATPVDLSQCLISRFDQVGDSRSVGVPVRLRVYNVFKGWLEGHWNVESDSAALGIIFSFATGKLRSALPAAGKRLAELTSKATEIRAGALVPRLASSLGKTGISGSVFVPADSTAPSPIVTRSQLNALKGWKEGKTQCSILDFDPLEVARQFTIIESKLFCNIQPEELLALEWTKKAGKGANVKAMSTLSNDLANLVIDTILHLEDVKRRAIVIKQWVKIAAKCLELNNYDSLMAILASLNTSMVLRLKRTWELVSAKTKARFDELKSITDHARNYAVLRQRLHDHFAPCIPYVGMYLTDLTFVDAGNGATRQLPGESGEDGIPVINFDKHMKTAKIIGQLQSFQVPYRLTPVPEMQEWIETQIQRMHSNDQVNPQSFHRQSLLLEPRDPPRVIKAVPPPIDSSASSTLTAVHRTGSKDRFEMLSLYFTTSNIKDR